MVKRNYLYGFIPMSIGEPMGPEFYRCLECRGKFQSDGQFCYDFGQHMERRTWRCFKCDHEISYEQFECPKCGYKFEIGRRG
jgi:hypothetical protein